jgi:hypothetical protein
MYLISSWEHTHNALKAKSNAKFYVSKFAIVIATSSSFFLFPVTKVIDIFFSFKVDMSRIELNMMKNLDMILIWNQN